jgi:hypothetical protein
LIAVTVTSPDLLAVYELGTTLFLPYPVAIFVAMPIASAIIVDFDTSPLAAAENRHPQVEK